jgi:AcrR family transcriptional regulator
VTAATRQLLEEAGFAGTTVQEISRRTGIHPPGIYRRWPSRLALIEDAAFGDLAAISVEPTGDRAADLLRFVQAYETRINTPVCRTAMPGLLAAYGAGAELPSDRWVHLSIRPTFAAILAAADDVDPTLDIDAAFEVLLSLVLARVVIPPVSRAERPPEHVVDILLRVLRSPSHHART